MHKMLETETVQPTKTKLEMMSINNLDFITFSF